MDKEKFQQTYEEIQVPEGAVKNAIIAGVQQANGVSGSSGKSRKNWRIILSTAAAVAVVSSSFFIPSISNVMAGTPIIGGLYESFNDRIGRSLASQQLVTEINETSSDKGVDVTINSAYYDGAVMGISFTVKGEVKEENGRVEGFYKIFDGDEGVSDSKELVYMEPSGDGYVGQVQTYYPEMDLPADTTFPFELKRIGGKEGSWRFDVPIQQLPYETIEVNKMSQVVEDGDVMVHVDSLIIGNASTTINYTATSPREGKHDQVRLELYDDQGESIQISSRIGLDSMEKDDKIIDKGRVIIPGLLEDTSYLKILPKVAIYEPDQYVKVTASAPIEVRSNRQDLSVMIERMDVRDKEVVIDFQLNKRNEKERDFLFFKQVADHDVTLVKKSEKDIYQEVMEHSTKTLDKDELRFRSSFDISGINDFNTEDYVFRVHLSSLSSNIPVELESVMIDLK
ncbi:DUF4179 domain-containing protein [Bacillus spongiae]|uniref:DUF4179 domain-containing protein n=1 Tax=Bacillus spongiae TaxID=2683610 RepID=A0ABU8HK78_9BACI